MTTPGRTFASGEDKPVNQKVSVQVFEKGGHRVTAAGNGCEAIGLMRKQRFEPSF
jgi:CheY-like chemotaxis protein